MIALYPPMSRSTRISEYNSRAAASPPIRSSGETEIHRVVDLEVAEDLPQSAVVARLGLSFGAVRVQHFVGAS